MSDRPRRMVTVFTVEVDQDDPHYIQATRYVGGLSYANRFTLAGVMRDLVETARSLGQGGVPQREVCNYPPDHPSHALYYRPGPGA